MKKKLVVVHTVVTLKPDGSIEWVYESYSSEKKADAIIAMLKKDGRKARSLYGQLE